ncbi:MAG TPA: NAD(P)-dependent oxidoreductase [Acidimicrobiales bacterium]|nr:NAD(P)-dependent oxidoreductase [Acidimicrobiales bacterium]
MSATSPSQGPAKERVGFVGLGTMGAYMAANLVRAGFPLTVWNRSAGRDGDLVELGAKVATSAAELARSCDVVVACLTDSPQVEEVLFGAEGLADGLAPGSLFIDCSTLSPLKASEFAERLSHQRVAMLDAPVSGGSEGAKNATLSIMVGGEDSDVERAGAVLAAMGRTVTHLGPVGAGQWAKAINQVILSGVYLGVAEGVTLGLKAGLDVERVLSALKGGAAGSWILENRSERMIRDEYPLGFKISLHRKDLGIGLDLAKSVGAVLPVTSLAATFEDGLIAQGYGDDDNSALARPIRRLSGL